MSRNVAVAHLPIDGNVETADSPSDGHAVAATSMDGSAAAFTDSSAAASMDVSVPKKQKRCERGRRRKSCQRVKTQPLKKRKQQTGRR